MSPIYTFSNDALLSINPLRNEKVIQLTCWFTCMALTQDGKIFIHLLYLRAWTLFSGLPLTMTNPETFSEIPVKVIQVEQAGHFGDETYFALTSEGFVYSWGGNNTGIRGHTFTTETVTTPAWIPSLRNISKIVAGSNDFENTHIALAINSTGHVFIWGSNEYGGLGLGISDVSQTSFVNIPQFIPFDYDVTGPFVGADIMESHVVAWTKKGQVFTWGKDDNFETTGTGVGNQNSPFNLTQSLYDVATLSISSPQVQDCSAATGATGCLISGKVFTFGASPVTGTIQQQISLVPNLDSADVIYFKLLREGGIAILSNQQVFTWGDNTRGKNCFDDYLQIQYAQPITQNPPTPFRPFLNSSEPELGQFSKVIVRSGEDCNLVVVMKPNSTKSSLHLWGVCSSNLNLGMVPPVKSPSANLYDSLLTSETIVDVSYLKTHALVLTDQGNVIGFGASSAFQFGSNPTEATRVDLLLDTPDWKVKRVSAGVDFSLLLLSNGTLVGSGDNNMGNLASTIKSVTTFTVLNTTILGMDSIMDIAACNGVSFIVSSSGKVFGAGSNTGLRLTNATTEDPIPYFVQLQGGIIDSKRIIKVVCYDYAVLLSDDGVAMVYMGGTSQVLNLTDPTDSVIDISTYRNEDQRGSKYNFDIHLMTRKGNVYGMGMNEFFEVSPTLENDISDTPTLTFSKSQQNGAIPYAIATGLRHGLAVVGTEWTCFSKNATDDTVCNSAGFCVAPDTCRCKHHAITGEDCRIFKCFGILRNESNVCSGVGNCTFLDTCQCPEGFIGSNCSVALPVCFGILSTKSNVCNGRGTCVATNTCECNDGYFGAQCEKQSCYSFSKFEKDLAATRRFSSMKINLCQKILNYL